MEFPGTSDAAGTGQQSVPGPPSRECGSRGSFLRRMFVYGVTAAAPPSKHGRFLVCSRSDVRGGI